MNPIQSVSQGELEQLARILGETFIQRWDLYGRQLDNGSYILVKEPLRAELLRGHLLGEITLSAYLLNRENHGRYLVFDADDEPDGRRLKGMALSLAEISASTYWEASRRGGHLWVFFDRPLPGL